jgi:pimeloyl-ACP methyl ester carboxylesterase
LSSILINSHHSPNIKHRIYTLPSETEQIRIKYVDATPPPISQASKGIVLIHGFPQTSYRFRHVIAPFILAGYRLIIPENRGAGDSTKPMDLQGYKRTSMATGLDALLKQHLHITEPVHVVGHDIGGMIAHAYAACYPSHYASVSWENVLSREADSTTEAKHASAFHFVFQRVLDLPEALIAGRERVYLKHFLDKHAYNAGAITPADLDFYEKMYALPGAIRVDVNVYRVFEDDAEENMGMRERDGKVNVRCFVLKGEKVSSLRGLNSKQVSFMKSLE